MAQGEVVYEALPFWKVLRKVDAKKSDRKAYVVIDTSPALHGKKPLQVYGPTDKDDAIGWARSFAMTYLTLKGVFL